MHIDELVQRNISLDQERVEQARIRNENLEREEQRRIRMQSIKQDILNQINVVINELNERSPSNAKINYKQAVSEWRFPSGHVLKLKEFGSASAFIIRAKGDVPEQRVFGVFNVENDNGFGIHILALENGQYEAAIVKYSPLVPQNRQQPFCLTNLRDLDLSINGTHTVVSQITDVKQAILQMINICL